MFNFCVPCTGVFTASTGLPQRRSPSCLGPPQGGGPALCDPCGQPARRADPGAGLPLPDRNDGSIKRGKERAPPPGRMELPALFRLPPIPYPNRRRTRETGWRGMYTKKPDLWIQATLIRICRNTEIWRIIFPFSGAVRRKRRRKPTPAAAIHSRGGAAPYNPMPS